MHFAVFRKHTWAQSIQETLCIPHVLHVFSMGLLWTMTRMTRREVGFPTKFNHFWMVISTLRLNLTTVLYTILDRLKQLISSPAECEGLFWIQESVQELCQSRSVGARGNHCCWDGVSDSKISKSIIESIQYCVQFPSAFMPPTDRKNHKKAGVVYLYSFCADTCIIYRFHCMPCKSIVFPCGYSGDTQSRGINGLIHYFTSSRILCALARKKGTVWALRIWI